MFKTMKDVCDEFDLDYTEDIDEILKKLTDIQSSLHPDKNPHYDSASKDKYNRVTEAKSFIRKNYQSSITVSDMMQLIKTINNTEITTVSKQAEQKLEKSYKEKYTQIKRSYLPKKIALGTIMAIVSFIWMFPSTLLDNPLIEPYISKSDYESIFHLLTLAWLVVLFAAIIVFLCILKRELYYKNTLDMFKNMDFQYDIFSSFIQLKLKKEEKEENNIVSSLSFTQKELENYILNKILFGYNPQIYYKSAPVFTSKKKIRSYIEDLLPKLSDIIISKAIEQGLIEKLNDLSWYNKYIVLNVGAFK